MGANLNRQYCWPDVLSRRLLARFGNKVAVTNAGITGNRILMTARRLNLLRWARP